MSISNFKRRGKTCLAPAAAAAEDANYSGATGAETVQYGRSMNSHKIQENFKNIVS